MVVYGNHCLFLVKSCFEQTNGNTMIVFFFSSPPSGHPRQWLCLESTTATAAKAHDPAPPASCHADPIALEMLRSGRTLAVGSDVENSPSTSPQSATIVSTLLPSSACRLFCCLFFFFCCFNYFHISVFIPSFCFLFLNY